MDDRTINSEVTMSGENATVLAGRYRIVRQLGQGGMGSVWLAEDTKLDGFKVAIKMLPSVLVNNKRAYAQVKSEALVSLKLSHPNIATVRAFEEESGSPFLVMDYIDGQTLDDYLAERGKLTEDETVKLLKPIAAALDYAHTQGVVHRDVKPGNVMIRKDGTPFVLDFGIAREIQETMTRVTGKLSSGTLLYMSPEQLNGDAPKPAQDIYSFAAMAYECLKGEPPFSRGGIEDQIKHKTPEALDEGVAIRLQVMAGLAKEAESRPSKCSEVLSLLSDQGPSCRSGVLKSACGNLSKWRNAFLPAALIIVALFLIGGVMIKRSLDAERGHRIATRAEREKSAAQTESADTTRRASETAEMDHEARSREKEQQEKRIAQQKSLEEEKARKTRADDARVEAKVQLAACRRVDSADEFKKLIEECAAAFDKAQAQYEVSRWGDATTGYSNVVERCKNVMRLDELRERAALDRKAMVESCRKAQAIGAATYAKTEFDAAVETMRKSAEEAKAMRFDSAKILYADAKIEFEKSISQAEREKQKIARKEADDRARAERQREIDKAAEKERYRNSDAGVRDRLAGKWQSTRYHEKTFRDGSLLRENDVVDFYEFFADGSFSRMVDDGTLSDRIKIVGQKGASIRGTWRIANGELELKWWGELSRIRLRWINDDSISMQWLSSSSAISVSGNTDGSVRITQKTKTGVIFKTDTELVSTCTPHSFKRVR